MGRFKALEKLDQKEKDIGPGTGSNAPHECSACEEPTGYHCIRGG